MRRWESIVRLLRLLGWFFTLAGCSVILFAGCSDWFADWSGEAVAESQQHGNQIVTALEAYKADHGVYPQDLGELVPKYLREIPPPVAGDRQWGYLPGDVGERFDLTVTGPTENDPIMGYHSPSKKWWMDTR